MKRIYISLPRQMAIAKVVWLPICLMVSLSGCELIESFSSPKEDLGAWISNTHATAKMSAGEALVPQAPVFYPYPYGISVNANQSPFEVTQIPGFVRGSRKTQINIPKSEFEMVNLDSIDFVGTMIRPNKKWGLVRINSIVHPIEIGQKLGSNGGVVSSIEDTKIMVREQTLNEEGIRKDVFKSIVLGGNRR